MPSTNSQNTSEGEALARTIRTTPTVIQLSCPLKRTCQTSQELVPLKSISCEVKDTCLDLEKNGLAHGRNIKQLSQILGTEPKWASVSVALDQKRLNGREHWVAECFAGTLVALIDNDYISDGLKEKHNYAGNFTPHVTKRLLLIERIAEGLMNKTCTTEDNPAGSERAFNAFLQSWENFCIGALNEDDVAGFKSVFNFGTSVAIPALPSRESAFRNFEEIRTRRKRNPTQQNLQLGYCGLYHYVLNCLARIIGAQPRQNRKPIQFHTGCVDDHSALTSATPTNLEPFLQQHSDVVIVLQHSPHQSVREISRLAIVHANVFAGIGQGFSRINQARQQAIVHEFLEFCPSSKIMWIMDVAGPPETCLLATMQMRQTLRAVFGECLRREDLHLIQATEYIRNILYHTPNICYNLGLSVDPSPALFASPSSHREDGLRDLLLRDYSILFVRVCWVDLNGLVRTRAVPRRHALQLLRYDRRFTLSVPKAALAILPNDHLVGSTSPSGEWDLHPDFGTVRPATRNTHVMLMANFKEKNGSPVMNCPRTILQHTLELLSSHDLTFRLGFEIEFVLLQRSGPRNYTAMETDAHSWCDLGAADHDKGAQVVEAAVAQLDKAGIYVEMVHPESAIGQYEIVLPAAPAMEAVDALIYSRQIIAACAKTQGYKMTLHPKPFMDAAGTAAHVHMSISSDRSNETRCYESFYGGILKHLPSIMAYTCASLVSYDRIVDRAWAGGTWITWGHQNRETPLRKIENSHWELKCIDGIGNPYLSMAAIFAAGLEGILCNQELVWQNCQVDPASLSPAQRGELNITQKLPSSIQEALLNLGENKHIRSLLGEEAVQSYIAMKEEETYMLNKLNENERRQWIIERY